MNKQQESTLRKLFRKLFDITPHTHVEWRSNDDDEMLIKCEYTECDVYMRTPYASQCSYGGTGKCGYELVWDGESINYDDSPDFSGGNVEPSRFPL
jgi:hypothetical protein